jgi:hypothetical protein
VVAKSSVSRGYNEESDGFVAKRFPGHFLALLLVAWSFKCQCTFRSIVGVAGASPMQLLDSNLGAATMQPRVHLTFSQTSQYSVGSISIACSSINWGLGCRSKLITSAHSKLLTSSHLKSSQWSNSLLLSSSSPPSLLRSSLPRLIPSRLILALSLPKYG